LSLLAIAVLGVATWGMLTARPAAAGDSGARSQENLPVQTASAPDGSLPVIPTAASATGLPLPRFASLKSDNVNLRQGPGPDYRILWIYKRAGLPVEILRQHEASRQVRDGDGPLGWAPSSLLSGPRTALVAPWAMRREEGQLRGSLDATLQPLRSDDDAHASTVAILEPGVVTTVLSCNGKWCRVAVDDLRGYIEQPRLWGVYEGEIVK